MGVWGLDYRLQNVLAHWLGLTPGQGKPRNTELYYRIASIITLSDYPSMERVPDPLFSTFSLGERWELAKAHA
jgi:hypothetical protein